MVTGRHKMASHQGYISRSSSQLPFNPLGFLGLNKYPELLLLTQP